MRPWTVKEYYRLGAAGVFRDQRVELIAGKIVQLPPHSDAHAIAVTLAGESMQKAFGAGFWVRPLAPLRLSGRSMPEPDVSVFPGDPRSHAGRGHRGQADLLP